MSIHKFANVVFIITLLFASTWVQAEKIVVPDKIAGSKKVSAEGIFEIIERIPNLLIIDARIRNDRRNGYIEESVSLPDINTSCKTLKKTIRTKNSPVLFYCNGPKCGRSAKSVKKAIKCGYKKIYWFRGGFEEWKAKGYPMIKK